MPRQGAGAKSNYSRVEAGRRCKLELQKSPGRAWVQGRTTAESRQGVGAR